MTNYRPAPVTDIRFADKVHIVKARVFQVVMWMKLDHKKKAEHRRMRVFSSCGAEEILESLGYKVIQISQS